MSQADVNHVLLTSDRRLPLDAVITTAELSMRKSRPPNYEAENRVLTSLMRAMADSTANVLQRLVDSVLELCGAHSAGISILEETEGRKIFRWHAVAGRWSTYFGSTMPREISPCGTVLDRNSPVLMSHPELHYPFPPEVSPLVSEVLLVPFHLTGEPVGTIWAIAHDDALKFDKEDERLLTSLGRFASTAYQVLSSHEQELAERRQAEEAAGRLAAIVESCDDAIVGKTLQGIITSWNHSAERIFGYTAAEAIGRHISLIIPMERLAEEDYVLSRLRRGVRVDHFETERRAKDGRTLTISLTVSPIKDSEGRVIGASKVARDITESRLREAELKAANSSLKRTNAILQQFTYSASHDLREPLYTMTSYGEMLVRKHGERLDKNVKTYVEFINKSANQMQSLLRDLLEYTRLELAEGGDKRPVDCQAALAAVLDSLKALLEENGAAVTSDPLPIILAQEVHIVQLFQNLIANAIKYRREEPPRVHVSVQEYNGSWRFSVEDNSIGIEPEYLTKIFGLFQRLSKDTPGTGLGLAICAKIVERYGGKIWVESEIGKGSKFFFTFPASDALAQ